METSDWDFISFLMTVIDNLIWRRVRMGRREIVRGDEAVFEMTRKVETIP